MKWKLTLTMETNTGSVAATAAASVEAPVEVANAALVTDVAEAEASSEIDAPVDGAAGSAESDLVASAGNDQVEGKVLRLRGGAPPGILLPARHVAGKRQRSPYKRSAINRLLLILLLLLLQRLLLSHLNCLLKLHLIQMFTVLPLMLLILRQRNQPRRRSLLGKAS